MGFTSPSETALSVIAVAVSLQALLMVAVTVGVVVWSRRIRASLDTKYAALSSRMDDAVFELRGAARSVARLSDRATGAMDEAGQAARHVATALAAPRNLLVAGATSVIGSLLARWRRPGTRRLQALGVSPAFDRSALKEKETNHA